MQHGRNGRYQNFSIMRTYHPIKRATIQKHVTITIPILKKSIKTAGILHVDDTNLWVGLNENNSLEDVAYDAQEAVSFWGNSLTD